MSASENNNRIQPSEKQPLCEMESEIKGESVSQTDNKDTDDIEEEDEDEDEEAEWGEDTPIKRQPPSRSLSAPPSTSYQKSNLRSSLREHPSHPKQSVKFTVTRVDSDDERPPAANGDPVGSGLGGDGEDAGGGEGTVTVTIQDGTAPTASDSESSCGDSLTQSSITALLSKKFKSYKTYKYAVANKQQQRARSKSLPAAPKRSSSTSSTSRERRERRADRRPGMRKRLMSKYESQDYDQCENALFLKEQETERSLSLRKKWLARWVVNLLTGVGTALVATIIEVSIEFSSHYKFWTLKQMVMWCDTGWCFALPLLAWITINCLLVFLGSLLVTCVEPQAVGSGIPQIKCYLNGVKIPGLLTLRALLSKSLGVILSVTGGLACGKEGPMIHSGAIVAAGVSQGRSRVFKRDFKIFEYLRSDTERRDFVSGGAAAGVSAAFGAPVGGVLFSLEEGASFWNQSLTWRIVFASMVATFTVNVILSAIHGHPADLSNPGLISFGHFPHITYQAIEIPIFLMMAVIGGLLGAIFNGINAKLTIFRKKFITKIWVKVLEAVIVAAVSAVMGFSLIYLVNDCVPDESRGHEDESVVQLFCPDGQHSVMSAIFFKTPERSLISILHDNQGSYSVLSLSLFAFLYFFLSCWTYGLSVSSGVFIPCLLTGAAWGRLIGMGVMYAFPQMGYDYGKHARISQSNNIGKYALIGAASQLGGIVRMTISLTVILIECTGDITFGLPIVMVLIIAKWVGDFFNTGLYDMHIQLMGIPLLPWEPPEMSYDISAKQVMNTPVFVLRVKEQVKRIVHVVENMPHLHSGFPVVDDYDPEQSPKDGNYGRCKGLILRSQLYLLLQHKVFTDDRAGGQGLETTERSRNSKELRLEDFRDVFPHNTKISMDVKMSEEDKDKWIDLTPYMNPTPYTVPMNASLPRMFRLFRGLGLRHLITVDDTNLVVGMVTRKDLAKYRLSAKGGSIKVQELHIHHD